MIITIIKAIVTRNILLYNNISVTGSSEFVTGTGSGGSGPIPSQGLPRRRTRFSRLHCYRARLQADTARRLTRGVRQHNNIILLHTRAHVTFVRPKPRRCNNHSVRREHKLVFSVFVTNTRTSKHIKYTYEHTYEV